MKCLLFAIAVTALLSAFFVAILDAAILPEFRSVVPIENSLSPVASYDTTRRKHKFPEWVKVKQNGARVVSVTRGTHLKFECEASGSPPPNVQWLHGVNPVLETVLESNSVRGVRLGTVKSILNIDCLSPRHQGVYTCVAQSASKTATSLPTVVIQENVTNLISPNPLCSQAMTSPPRILSWSPLNMDTIGNDVLLPCIAVGNPAPQIYWLDKENNLITAESAPDPRYKLLETGDLIISNVNWSDMGGFSCVAENPLGRDTITTFLYPMLEE